MTRAEHIEWCKQRAREYLDKGDLRNAVASMTSDLSKHPETQCPPTVAMVGMMAVRNHDSHGVRCFIEGFD